MKNTIYILILLLQTSCSSHYSCKKDAESRRKYGDLKIKFENLTSSNSLITELSVPISYFSIRIFEFTPIIISSKNNEFEAIDFNELENIDKTYNGLFLGASCRSSPSDPSITEVKIDSKTLYFSFFPHSIEINNVYFSKISWIYDNHVYTHNFKYLYSHSFLEPESKGRFLFDLDKDIEIKNLDTLVLGYNFDEILVDKKEKNALCSNEDKSICIDLSKVKWKIRKS